MSKKLDKYRDEINEHLDIKRLLKRLIKLEECIEFLMKEDEINFIKNHKAISYEKAKYFRNLLNT